MSVASLCRRAMERLSRGVVLRRRLPAEFRRRSIFVSPEAGLKYWRSNLYNADPVLFRMATELVREGDVVWDIGANVGLFAFAAASIAGAKGQIVAIEPDSWLCSLLLRSADCDSDAGAPVTVLSAAISDCYGFQRLQIAARSRSANHLEGIVSRAAGGVRGQQWTPTFNLDGLLEYFPHPQVLKIDVEGMEHRVLAGATKLLSQIRPRIWCEVWSQNQPEVTRILHGTDYFLYPATARIGERKALDLACWDTLALPQTKVRRVVAP